MIKILGTIRWILLGVILSITLLSSSYAEGINQNGVEFHIIEEVKIRYPELIEMILATESIDDKERQYWFDILPSMTEAQITRLFEILANERRQLDDLNEKYSNPWGQVLPFAPSPRNLRPWLALFALNSPARFTT